MITIAFRLCFVVSLVTVITLTQTLQLKYVCIIKHHTIIMKEAVIHEILHNHKAVGCSHNTHRYNITANDR